jgi:hypothetical protein
MPAVTTVTTRAVSADDLSESDYREIYTELREQTTLRKFAEVIESQYSFAWWSKFEREVGQLTRPARQELRRAVGLPALPPTVDEAMAGVDPDATVYRVDDRQQTADDRRQADRVVLVAVRGPVSLNLNGDLEVVECAPDGQERDYVVTGVTRRRQRKGVSIRPTTWESLNDARKQAGKTWDEFLTDLIGKEA